MVPVVMGLQHPPLPEIQVAEREVAPPERAGIDGGEALERLPAALARGPHVVQELADRVALLGAHDRGRLTGTVGPGWERCERRKVGRVGAGRLLPSGAST